MTELQSITIRLEQPMEPLIICSAVEDDYLQIANLKNTILEEGIFLLLTSEENKISESEMKNFIQAYRENEGAVLLVAKMGNHIVGVLEFISGHAERIKHAGNLEIYLHKDYRNSGIGTKLMETLFKWIDKHPFIEIVHLNVHATNQAAINFYNKFDFIIDGTKKRGLKYGAGDYVDVILMSKYFKK